MYSRVIFLAAHTHVLCMGSGSVTIVFLPAPRLVHSSLGPILTSSFFLQISAVILNKMNSTLYSQIFEFDISIQILMCIFCSTYRKGSHFEAKVTCQRSIVSLLHDTVHHAHGNVLCIIFSLELIIINPTSKVSSPLKNPIKSSSITNHSS